MGPGFLDGYTKQNPASSSDNLVYVLDQLTPLFCSEAVEGLGDFIFGPSQLSNMELKRVRRGWEVPLLDVLDVLSEPVDLTLKDG